MEKKELVQAILMDIFTNMGIDRPTNFDEISEFVFDDVCETADENNWHSGDVAIGFRRWIEAQSK
jgi:hypothetical protein